MCLLELGNRLVGGLEGRSRGRGQIKRNPGTCERAIPTTEGLWSDVSSWAKKAHPRAHVHPMILVTANNSIFSVRATRPTYLEMIVGGLRASSARFWIPRMRARPGWYADRGATSGRPEHKILVASTESALYFGSMQLGMRDVAAALPSSNTRAVFA